MNTRTRNARVKLETSQEARALFRAYNFVHDRALPHKMFPFVLCLFSVVFGRPFQSGPPFAMSFVGTIRYPEITSKVWIDSVTGLFREDQFANGQYLGMRYPLVFACW